MSGEFEPSQANESLSPEALEVLELHAQATQEYQAAVAAAKQDAHQQVPVTEHDTQLARQRMGRINRVNKAKVELEAVTRRLTALGKDTQ